MRICSNVLSFFKILCIPIFVLLFSVALRSDVHAALVDGDLDTTFQNNSAVLGFDSNPETVVVQPDGKILVGGRFTTYKGGPAPYLVRFNTDGSIDNTFSLDGTGFDEYVGTVIIQSDGKIIVTGGFSSYNGIEKHDILRLNGDGSLDTTFDAGSGCDTWNNIYTVKLLENGKLLIGGSFVSFDEITAKYLVRLNSDGSVDDTFAQEGTGLNNYVFDIDLQEDGKILVAGQFSKYNETVVRGLVRLNIDGSFDDAFNFNVDRGNLQSVAIQENGKILIGGEVVIDYGEDDNYSFSYLLRLNSDGSIDDTFNTGTGFGQSPGGEPRIYAMEIQGDGKILVGGEFLEYDSHPAAYFVRLNSNGTFDSSFSLSEIGFNNYVTQLYLGDDDEIFVLGNFLSYGIDTCPMIVSMNSDGSLKNTFVHNVGGFNESVDVVQIQADGKILVGGSFSTYGRTYTPYIARLNADGTLDTTFSQAGRGLAGEGGISTIAVQTNGKIVVGGFFSYYNDTYIGKLTRLNSDGSLDTSFDMGDGLNSQVLKIVIQEDGKILATGNFNYYGADEIPGVIRINNDGSLDSSFNIDTSVEYDFPIALQEDGKILVVDEDHSKLMRLNSDGSVDTAFNVAGNIFSRNILSVSVQSDEKIIVSGWFEQYGEDSVASVVRLNSDGTLDSTFNATDSGLEDYTFFTKLQSDGKIVILTIDPFSEDWLSKILRLNTDGSLDTTFDMGTGFDSYVADLEIQSDGKILVGGEFSEYNGTQVAYLARLNVHHEPIAPSNLKVNNSVNPTNLETLTPNFSALLTDTDTSDFILKYQIQVSNNSLFTGTNMWDSGVKTFTTPVVHNNRTSNIAYAGLPLTLDGTRYYWRIKVWDSLNDPSEWSSANTFTMASYTLNTPSGFVISPNSYTKNNRFSLTWNTGNARVKSYEYKTGGTWIATTTNSVNPLFAYKEGQNIVQVRNVDSAGNKSNPTSVSYYYDSVAPTPPSNIVGSGKTLSWTESIDAGSGIAGYEYKIGDLTSWIGTEETRVSEMLGLKEGENTIYVRGIDRVGNKSEPVSLVYLYGGESQAESPKPQMSFVREGSDSSIQSDTVAVKGGESVTITIPVSEVAVTGDTVSQVYVEIDGQKTLLTLDSEKKIYTAKVSIPKGRAKGSVLQTNQVVEYASGEKSVKGVSIVIDPFGYIYTKVNGEEKRLENAKVILYSYANGEKKLYVFNDSTQNPQNTDSEGEYSFFVPNGKYILVVELEGYKTYTSNVFEVNSGAVEQNIEIKKKLPLYIYLVGGGVFILLCAGVLVLKKKEVVN